MKSAISIKNLGKTYQPKKGAEKVALDDVNLEIPQGSFFGLLGPNGAGKSTLINILAGLVHKTAGEVIVDGNDLDKNPRDVKYSLGVVPQELILDPFFNVREALEIHAGYYGIRKKDRRTDEIINALALNDKSATNSRRLSGGMRRRLLIGKALVHSPKVLILDEPTAGVDIELRQSLWGYVRKLNEQGTTVILTTHYLEEAEELCDEIAIINHGKIIANDTKEKLMANLNNKRMVLKLNEKPKKIPANLKKYNAKIIQNKNIEFIYNPKEVELCKILEEITKTGLDVTDLTSEDAKLEDIFLQLTKAA